MIQSQSGKILQKVPGIKKERIKVILPLLRRQSNKIDDLGS